MDHVAKYVATLVACLVLMFSATDLVAKNCTGSLSRSTYAAYSLSDTDKLYLTVVGSSEDAEYQKLCSLFAAQPEFVAVRDASHYHAMTRQSTMYRARYAKDFQAFPTVRLQTADGTPVKEWSGKNIPDSQVLLSELQCLPWRRQRPQPNPTPTPDVTPQPTPRPTPRPRPVRPTGLPFWVFGTAVLSGVAVAAWHELSSDLK